MRKNEQMVIRHGAAGSTMQAKGQIEPVEFNNSDVRDRAGVATLFCSVLGIDRFAVPSAMGK